MAGEAPLNAARSSGAETSGRPVTRRSEKQLEHLDSIEAAFRERLVGELEVCAAGRNSLLFLASSMKPAVWWGVPRSVVTDELLESAEEIMTLRRQHGLSTSGSLAQRFREVCIRHVDLEAHHRLGSRRQAEQLLSEIMDSRQSGGPTSRSKRRGAPSHQRDSRATDRAPRA